MKLSPWKNPATKKATAAAKQSPAPTYGASAPSAPTAPVAPAGLSPDEQFYFDANSRRIADQYGLATNQVVFQHEQAQLNQALAEKQLREKIEMIRRRLPGQYAARGLLNSGIYAQGLTDQAVQEQAAYDSLRRQYEEMVGGLGLQQYQLDYTKGTAQRDLEEQRQARLNTIRTSLGG